ncbi:MAG TPA: hypothetical protein VHB49_15960 [Bradyrhizobium sp.]|nr:hypothetical protein [Bradyrhizobium sp.]
MGGPLAVTLRPMRRHANESGKGGDIDEGFNPLHIASNRRFEIGSGMPGLHVCGNNNRREARLFGGLLSLFLQQPHQMRHAGIVFMLGRRRWLVVPVPSFEPFENHGRPID